MSAVRHRALATLVAGAVLFRPRFLRVRGPCYDSAMRNLVVLFIHFITTLARVLGPGSMRSIVAESLLLKHQLLIVNRSHRRSPNLSGWDLWSTWKRSLILVTPETVSRWPGVVFACTGE